MPKIRGKKVTVVEMVVNGITIKNDCVLYHPQIPSRVGFRVTATPKQAVKAQVQIGDTIGHDDFGINTAFFVQVMKRKKTQRIRVKLS